MSYSRDLLLIFASCSRERRLQLKTAPGVLFRLKGLSLLEQERRVVIAIESASRLLARDLSLKIDSRSAKIIKMSMTEIRTHHLIALVFEFFPLKLF